MDSNVFCNIGGQNQFTDDIDCYIGFQQHKNPSRAIKFDKKTADFIIF